MSLHIVSASPFTSTALTTCLNVATTDDAILLMGDGLYACNTPHLANAPAKIYYMDCDRTARGIEAPKQGTGIDYQGMVALTEQYNPIQTWS